MALRYSFDWEAAFEGMLQVQSQVSSFGTAYLQLGCFVGNTPNLFYYTQICYLFFPLIAVVPVTGTPGDGRCTRL